MMNIHALTFKVDRMRGKVRTGISRFRNLRNQFIVFFFFWGIAIGTMIARPRQLNADSTPLAVNLDDAPQYSYKTKVLATIKNGSKPGEVKMHSTSDAPEGPDVITADRQGNVYINDKLNHRIEEFSKGGKFVDVVFRYANDIGIGAMVVDQTGHLFLHLRTLGGVEVWEVFKGKIEHKYPAHNFLILGLDGKPWFSDRQAPELLDSLDGKTHVNVDKSASERVLPWREGRKIIISKVDQQHRFLITEEAHGARKPIAAFYASQGIDWLSPLLTNSTHIFIMSTLGNGTTRRVVDIDLAHNTAKVIAGPSFGGFEHMAANGNYYTFEIDEVGGMGSDILQFQLKESFPVGADE